MRIPNKKYISLKHGRRNMGGGAEGNAPPPQYFANQKYELKNNEI